MSEKLSFVFFGSGPVAAKSLKFLANTFSVEAVVTKPSTEQEMLSIVQDTPVYGVSTKAELDNLIEKQGFTSSLGVLIDFGIIVSKTVINSFNLGIVNSHFSVLPELRGADPITFAILSGQKQTGVSMMLLVEAMDEGPLIAFTEYDLPENINAPQLTNKLIDLSNGLLREFLPRYVANPADLKSQDVTGRQVSYSRKLTKEDGKLDWKKPAEELEREVRAFATWPRSSFRTNGRSYIVHTAEAEPKAIAEYPGTIVSVEHALGIQTSDGVLWITSIQPEGKKQMPIREFLNGYRGVLGAQTD